MVMPSFLRYEPVKQVMEQKILSSSEELSLYINTIESFFKRNFPKLEKDKFWPWFLKMLTNKEYYMNNLATQETEEILCKLKELGDLLFDPRKVHDIN